MKVLKLITKNAGRHKLRTALTVLGLALAVMAFGLIRTFIFAWYAGERTASPDRLVTRHTVSVVFTLPIAYEEQILLMPGVKDITFGAWFGGIYIDEKNFFPQFAVQANSFFRVYPEYLVPPDQMKAFLEDRRGAIVGQGLVDRYGWKIGDQITLVGTIYPGDWPFVIRGIYHGANPDVDETTFIFDFAYVDERMKQETPIRAGQIGWYVLKIDDPSHAGEIGAKIDAKYENSWAATKTETEKEFALTFIQMWGTIIVGLRIASYLIIGVIFLVLANTMAMTARERVSEYAFMRTLGFRGYHLIGLILGESIFIGVIGGLVGMIFLGMVGRGAGVALSQIFPGFTVQLMTYLGSLLTAVIIGFAASIFPIARALRINIVDGLRVVD